MPTTSRDFTWRLLCEDEEDIETYNSEIRDALISVGLYKDVGNIIIDYQNQLTLMEEEYRDINELNKCMMLSELKDRMKLKESVFVFDPETMLPVFLRR